MSRQEWSDYARGRRPGNPWVERALGTVAILGTLWAIWSALGLF